ncbi:MAG: hypothetical protein HYX87_06680 [Chloroflexi bacterium]|nr:hypothetical protein [Chloroflexota bacterium]
MNRQDFWHQPRAELPGAVPTGTRAGQFLFLSPQTSVDVDTGKLVRDFVDLPPDVGKKLAIPMAHHLNAYVSPIMAQTWTIYQNLSRILERQGASLRDIVRQRIFLRDISDVGWMERVMLTFFPEEKPVTLILGVPDRGLHEDVRIWVEVIALVPEAGGLRKETIYLPELKRVFGPYPAAVKAGQLLFFDGVRGVDSQTGRPVTTLDEVGEEAKSELEGLYIDPTSEAMKAQFWLLYNRYFRLILESQGASMDDILHTWGYYRHGMKEAAEREYLRRKLHQKVERSAPSTGCRLSNLSIISDVVIIRGAVALLPGDIKKQSLRYSDTDVVGRYSALARGGPYWLAAGMIAVDIAKQEHIVSFGDLEDEGRFLAQSRIDDNETIMAKAWHIYHYMLDNIQTRPEEVIHQTLYMVNPLEWPAVQSVANIVFGGHIPPTTIIPVDEVAFYWQYHQRTQHMPKSRGGERLEIQLWGMTS